MICTARTALLASTIATVPETALRRRRWAAWGKRASKFYQAGPVGDLVTDDQFWAMPPWLRASGPVLETSYMRDGSIQERVYQPVTFDEAAPIPNKAWDDVAATMTLADGRVALISRAELFAK